MSRAPALNAHQIEHPAFNDLAAEPLNALGLILEIVSWTLRLFVPTGAAGSDVLARFVERYPLQRAAERHAAKAA